MQTVETAIGLGKSTTETIYECYTLYTDLEAARYSCMERIPRKDKKKMKKNKEIYAKFKEMKNVK